MAKRWPPMVGIVGFDGGYKPAVALALPPDELGSDEGEEEGGGGPGDETGACCNPDGSCDDDVTQFDCTSSGGIFQGVGTDCDSNPCEQPPASGACCVGMDCSIQTQDDCESGGGTYQGDDTTCDPNPCLPPCCPNAFAAFDGSGRMFLTYSWSTTGTTSCDPFPGCTGTRTSDWTASGSTTIDPDTCEETCECSGSGSGVVDNHGSPECEAANCSGTLTASSCTGSSNNPCSSLQSDVVASTECVWNGSGCADGAGLNNLFSCHGGRVDTEEVISATEKLFHYDLNTNCIGTATKTVTLSDECTPV